MVGVAPTDKSGQLAGSVWICGSAEVHLQPEILERYFEAKGRMRQPTQVEVTQCWWSAQTVSHARSTCVMNALNSLDRSSVTGSFCTQSPLITHSPCHPVRFPLTCGLGAFLLGTETDNRSPSGSAGYTKHTLSLTKATKNQRLRKWETFPVTIFWRIRKWESRVRMCEQTFAKNGGRGERMFTNADTTTILYYSDNGYYGNSWSKITEKPVVPRVPGVNEAYATNRKLVQICERTQKQTRTNAVIQKWITNKPGTLTARWFIRESVTGKSIVSHFSDSIILSLTSCTRQTRQTQHGKA